MTSARLILQFDMRRLPHEYLADTYDYAMHLEVDPVTIPDSMHPCVIVQRGSASLPEQVLRLATFEELYGGSPAPLLPSTVTLFTSAVFGAFAVGTVIRVFHPEWWRSYFSTAEYTEHTLAAGGVVTPAFPAFSRGLRFQVKVPPATAFSTDFFDGVANRVYADSASEYRCEAHYSTWDNYDDATAKRTVLPAQGQSLVNRYNEDNYTDESTVVLV